MITLSFALFPNLEFINGILKQSSHGFFASIFSMSVSMLLCQLYSDFLLNSFDLTS